MLVNPAPEGRPNLAQRFSAGNTGTHDSSPGGTTEFRWLLRCLKASSEQLLLKLQTPLSLC